MKKIYPASGLLPQRAYFDEQRDDQGKDLVTNWKGVIQAPGHGFCVHNLHDSPFPNGFGPNYPVVFIQDGPYGGHFFYIGHCTSALSEGQHFNFGDVLAHADQGHDFEGTKGGWVEFGEAPGGFPGPASPTHWFDDLIRKPLVVNVPDPALHWGDSGLRVLGVSSRLRDCGYLTRPYWHFHQEVHGAVKKFRQHHKLPALVRGFGQDGGVVDTQCDVALLHASAWCKKHHKHEVV